MFLLDLSHTSHTRARTGVQRVARALQRELGSRAVAVTHDPFMRIWRRLEIWEQRNLAVSQGGTKRKAQWPQMTQWRGRWRRVLGRNASHALSGDYDALIEPEIFSPTVNREFAALFAHVRGPRIAVFHDSIPLHFPELTPLSTVARYPTYLRELLQFDGIAANSVDSQQALTGYWRWLGIRQPPPVAAIPLGVSAPSLSAEERIPPDRPMPLVLTVGTLEGRKNHLALLEACEQLWTAGRKFELRVIGHVNAETGRAAEQRIHTLQAAGRPVYFDGPGSDEEIARSYAACSFTVYPSLAEGFGLPVIESLERAKPCICSAAGALGEISRGGGCLALDSVDPGSLVSAIGLLLDRPDELARLTEAARTRTFRSWSDYAAELIAWTQSLPRR